MAAIVLALAVLVAACGRLGFDPRDGGGGDGAGTADGAGFIGATTLYAKASDTADADVFGASVAISADGSTVAVAAFDEDSAATGIGGDQTSTAAMDSGAVYVFRRAGTWTQEAYVKASNTGPADRFGRSLALSADGSTMAVAANREDSAATGIDGDETSNAAMDSGAVYVFTRVGAAWAQEAYLKPSNTGGGDNFGTSIALSADGGTLAVGAFFEDSAAFGVGGDQADDTAPNSGAVYVFTRAGSTWTQTAYLKASNTEAGDNFGEAVALSADGATLAISAPLEDSAATGIDGDQTDNSLNEAGAVYVFAWTGSAWTQAAYVKPSHLDLIDPGGAFDQFGWGVAISDDGRTLAVGARLEASAATGIDGDQLDNSAGGSGAVYVFARGVGWTQEAYIKPSNTGVNDFFGEAVALSGDGNTLAVTAPFEDSAASGIGGDDSDEAATDSGAIYVFSRAGATWTQRAYVKTTNNEAGDSASAVALSGDASTLVVGAMGEDGGGTGLGADPSDDSANEAGAVYLYY